MCPITRTCSEHKSCWQSPPERRAASAPAVHARITCGFSECPFSEYPITRTCYEHKSRWQSRARPRGRFMHELRESFLNTRFLNVFDRANLFGMQAMLAAAPAPSRFHAGSACTDSVCTLRIPVSECVRLREPVLNASHAVLRAALRPGHGDRLGMRIPWRVGLDHVLVDVGTPTRPRRHD
jgi:hypothetical protein